MVLKYPVNYIVRQITLISIFRIYILNAYEAVCQR